MAMSFGAGLAVGTDGIAPVVSVSLIVTPGPIIMNVLALVIIGRVGGVAAAAKAIGHQPVTTPATPEATDPLLCPRTGLDWDFNFRMGMGYGLGHCVLPWLGEGVGGVGGIAWGYFLGFLSSGWVGGSGMGLGLGAGTSSFSMSLHCTASPWRMPQWVHSSHPACLMYPQQAQMSLIHSHQWWPWCDNPRCHPASWSSCQPQPALKACWI